MSLTSSCPKCQKQVMVPDGLGADVQVRCPLCEAEYTVGEALAMAPPALIVVSPILVAPSPEPVIAPVEPGTEIEASGALAGELSPIASAEAHAEQAAPIAAEQAAEAVLFGVTPAAEGEVEGEPLEEQGSWHAPWHGMKDEAAGEDSEPIAFADEEKEPDLSGVDFAAITGKAPVAQAAEGAPVVALPPLKKKKKKREANMFVRLFGMLLAGGLALPCVYALALWIGGPKNDIFHLYYKTNGPKHHAAAKDSLKAADPEAAKQEPEGAKQEAAPGGVPGKWEIPANPAPQPKFDPVAPKPQPGGPAAKPQPKPGHKPMANAGVKPDDSSDMDDKPEPKADAVLPGVPNVDAFAPPAAAFTPVAVPKAGAGSKPAAKPEAKPETGPIPPAKVNLDAPAPPQPASKPEAKPEAKPATKPEAKPEAKPAAKPEAKPAQPKVENQPQAKPAPAANAIGPLQAPSFKADDLGLALKDVIAVYGCPACSSKGTTTKDGKEVPCDVCKGKPSTELTDQAYEKLCLLAQRVTFAQGGADAQKQAILALMQRIAASPQGAEKIIGRAKKLIDAKAKGGIVLAGTVSKVAVKDGIYGAAVLLDALSKPIMIMNTQPLGVQENERVLVLGSAIVEPTKNLAGYKGTQPLVIWAGMPVKLP